MPTPEDLSDRDAVLAEVRYLRDRDCSDAQIADAILSCLASRGVSREALDAAIRNLAECFRQTGADPDGNEDWRLARDAVREVTEFRVEYDKLADENIALRAERDAAVARAAEHAERVADRDSLIALLRAEAAALREALTRISSVDLDATHTTAHMLQHYARQALAGATTEQQRGQGEGTP